MVARVVMVVALALVIAPARAHADVASGVRFAVPAGWAAADRDGLRVVAPTNLATGELMVAMIAGVQAASGTPDAQLAALAATYNAGATVGASSASALTDLGKAGKLYLQQFQVTAPDLGEHRRILAILVRGSQRAVVLVVFSNDAVLAKHGAGMTALLKSLAIDPRAVVQPAPPAPPAAAPPAAAPVATGGHLATGDTPDRYPGSPGWMPSGRGVAIPVTKLVGGRPQGLWWRYHVNGSAMAPLLMAFLPDGTYVVHPRPGSGQLLDIAQQRKQPGSNGVGTFTIADGRYTHVVDGYTTTDTFKAGTDKNGEWFEVGAGRHYPLVPATPAFLVGTWTGGGNRLVFRADGTYEYGHITNNAEVTIAAGARGTFQLDGYLLALRPTQYDPYTSVAGRSGTLLVVGMTTYSRQ